MATVGVVLFVLSPIRLGCSLDRMAAVRHANRTAPVPQPDGPVRAYTLAPLGVVILAFDVLMFTSCPR